MHLKKIFAVALAALMLLSLFACGKSEDEYISGNNNEFAAHEVELLPNEAGKLTIYAEADLQLVYDKTGKVIALTALSAQADDIASNYEFADKDCAQAAVELIDLIIDGNISITKGYILIRQELGAASPSDDFLSAVQESALQNKGEYKVVTVSVEDLDADGLFSKDTALAVLAASQPTTEGCILECSDEPIAGSYSVFCTTAEDLTIEYSISALDGSVFQAENNSQEEQEPTDETDPTPESDIMDPIPDTEANKGTDGGVDNGSVEFG